MSATSALMRGRARAQALMVDACTVTRLNRGATTTDPETGVVTPVYTTIYTGACKVQDAGQSEVARPEEVGQAERYLSRLTLHVPVTDVTGGITSDDIVTVTASASDPGLVGQVFHVRMVSHKSWLTGRRFGIEEVTS